MAARTSGTGPKRPCRTARSPSTGRSCASAEEASGPPRFVVRETVDDALTGAVSVMHSASLRLAPWTLSTPVQQGDSALRLNVHFRVLALDGVYVRDAQSGELVFRGFGVGVLARASAVLAQG